MNIKWNIMKRSIFIIQRFLAISLFLWRKFTFVALFLSNYFEAYLMALKDYASMKKYSLDSRIRSYEHKQILHFTWMENLFISAMLSNILREQGERVGTKIPGSFTFRWLPFFAFLLPNVAPAFFLTSRLVKFSSWIASYVTIILVEWKFYIFFFLSTDTVACTQC